MSADTGALVGLIADAALFGICYKWYKSVTRDAEHVKHAKLLTIDRSLQEELRDGSIAYACVEGSVTPVGTPLKSSFKDGEKGVIQQISMVEHKSKRSQGFWSDTKNVIRDTLNTIQFKLRGEDDTFVNVAEPMNAGFLLDDLTVTHDIFTPNQASFIQRGIDRIAGEVSKGYQETEKMLLANSMLLGIGELVYHKGKITLQRPPDKMYILTSMSKGQVIRKLESKAFWIKVFASMTALVGAGIVFYLIRKWMIQRKENRLQNAFQEQMQAARIQRRNQQNNAEADDNDGGDIDANSCVVCLTKPREVILLECGHVCVCGDCVLVLPKPIKCPICRQTVVRYLPVYNP